MDRFPLPDQAPATDPVDSDLAHPVWCEPRSCAAVSGGPHRSSSVKVAGDGVGSARLRLRVWQPSDDPVGQVVLVELVVGDRDGGRRLRVDLSLTQLEAVRRLLALIAAQVGQP